MKKIIGQILIWFVLAISIAAQGNENQPELFDEFGRLSNDDLSAPKSESRILFFRSV